MARRHEVLQSDRAEQALAVVVGASHRLQSPGLQPARSCFKVRTVTIGISTVCEPSHWVTRLDHLKKKLVTKEVFGGLTTVMIMRTLALCRINHLTY